MPRSTSGSVVASRQWPAVSTHDGWIRVPPQNWAWKLSATAGWSRPTWAGYSPTSAGRLRVTADESVPELARTAASTSTATGAILRRLIGASMADVAEPVRLVVHGHFYQPPRENPWTEEVPVEPSAAPFHDWNERITAECYRPNGWARVLDEHGRVAGVVDNYAHLSFNVGPDAAVLARRATTPTWRPAWSRATAPPAAPSPRRTTT